MQLIKFDPEYVNNLSREAKYALQAWNRMRNEYYQGLWNPEHIPDMVRVLLRPFYGSVHDTKVVKTRWQTEESTLKGAKTTNDHLYSPQFFGAFFYYYADKYLVPEDSFELFFEKFNELRKTIVVTRSQNKKLSLLTSPNPANVLTGKEKVDFLPDEKYVHLGYRLYNDEYCMYQEQCSDDPFPFSLDAELMSWLNSYQ